MIQRIQSLYLLLTSLLSLLFLSGSFLKFFNKSGSEIIMDFNGIWQSSGTGSPDLIQSQIPLSVIIMLIPVVSTITLFLYKNRRLQLKLTIVVILLAFVLLFYLTIFAILIITRYNVELAPVIRIIIPPIILILTLLAYSGIKKDENLVRSYDRLR